MSAGSDTSGYSVHSLTLMAAAAAGLACAVVWQTRQRRASDDSGQIEGRGQNARSGDPHAPSLWSFTAALSGRALCSATTTQFYEDGRDDVDVGRTISYASRCEGTSPEESFMAGNRASDSISLSAGSNLQSQPHSLSAGTSLLQQDCPKAPSLQTGPQLDLANVLDLRNASLALLMSSYYSQLTSLSATDGLVSSSKVTSPFAAWSLKPFGDAPVTPPRPEQRRTERGRSSSQGQPRTQQTRDATEQGPPDSSSVSASSATSELALNAESSLRNGVEAALSAQDSERRFSRVFSEASDPNAPFNDWELMRDEVEILTKPDGSQWVLGTGAFGKVYKALKDKVTPCAVKVFKQAEKPIGRLQRMRTGCILQDPAAMQREVAILRSCRDRHIVQFLGAVLDERSPMLVTEFMEGGDLFAAMQASGAFRWYRQGLPVRTTSGRDSMPLPGLAKSVALDVARGLHFLHRRRIVHLDLKSPNILLGSNHAAKIADVGMALPLDDSGHVSVEECPFVCAWSAPEVVPGARVGAAADVYSFGVVLWELVCGEVPQPNNMRAPKVPEECPTAVAEVIQRCMAHDPAQRPTARELVGLLGDIDVELEAAQQQRRSLRYQRSASNPSSRSHQASDPPEQRAWLESLVNLWRLLHPTERTFDYEAARKLTVEDHRCAAKLWHQQMVACLADEEVDEPGSDSNLQARALMEAVRATGRLMHAAEPRTRRHRPRTSGLDTVKSGEHLQSMLSPICEKAVDWRGVLNAMQLSAEQQTALICTRSIIKCQLGKVNEKRRHLVGVLQASTTPRRQGKPAAMLSVQEAAEQLHHNLLKETQLLEEFRSRFFEVELGEEGTLVEARARVASYPAAPDLVAVSALLVEDVADSFTANFRASCADDTNATAAEDLKARAASMP